MRPQHRHTLTPEDINLEIVAEQAGLSRRRDSSNSAEEEAQQQALGQRGQVNNNNFNSFRSRAFKPNSSAPRRRLTDGGRSFNQSTFAAHVRQHARGASASMPSRRGGHWSSHSTRGQNSPRVNDDIDNIIAGGRRGQSGSANEASSTVPNNSSRKTSDASNHSAKTVIQAAGTLRTAKNDTQKGKSTDTDNKSKQPKTNFALAGSKTSGESKMAIHPYKNAIDDKSTQEGKNASRDGPQSKAKAKKSNHKKRASSCSTKTVRGDVKSSSPKPMGPKSLNEKTTTIDQKGKTDMKQKHTEVRGRDLDGFQYLRNQKISSASSESFVPATVQQNHIWDDVPKLLRSIPTTPVNYDPAQTPQRHMHNTWSTTPRFDPIQALDPLTPTKSGQMRERSQSSASSSYNSPASLGRSPSRQYIPSYQYQYNQQQRSSGRLSPYSNHNNRQSYSPHRTQHTSAISSIYAGYNHSSHTPSLGTQFSNLIISTGPRHHPSVYHYNRREPDLSPPNEYYYSNRGGIPQHQTGYPQGKDLYTHSQYQMLESNIEYPNTMSQSSPPTPRSYGNHPTFQNPSNVESGKRVQQSRNMPDGNKFGNFSGNQSWSEESGPQRTPSLQEPHKPPRSPSPPSLIKQCIIDNTLLWPAGPFIPWNMWGCCPLDMESTNFVNVLCTSVGILRLPFSIPFLRCLQQVLRPKIGDHVITFPTMLADPDDMAPYWERCYQASQFLWNNAKHLGYKPFDELPPSEWPKVEILLGSDNMPDSKFNVYMSQRDEKRLVFRCVEQKLNENDNEPKATFFVTVHQTGVHQIQYSDPRTQDPAMRLPSRIGGLDPRMAPEYQYRLPNYLCMNESRGVHVHGFDDIGIPADKTQDHPFTEKNYDQLWFGMAQLQEYVCKDDLRSMSMLAPNQDPEVVFGEGRAAELRARAERMKGKTGDKFLPHNHVLALNFCTPDGKEEKK